MKKFMKKFALTSLLFSSLFSGSAAALAQETNEDLSGEIEFYTSQPDVDAEQLVEAYNELYPNVTVNIFRSGTEEVVSKINAENTAGEVLADVILLADAVTFESFKEQDMLLEYVSPEAENIDEEFVDADGFYTGTKIMTTGIVYNTDNVEEAPTSWSALTDEANAEQVVMPSPLYSGAAAYNLGVLTRSEGFGWEFYEGLQANSPMITEGNGAVIENVASGQRSYGMIVDYLATRAVADGSPVEFVYPEEGVPVITEPVGIMSATQEEEIAQTFVDFILSEEGQVLQSELGYAPIRSGVEAPEGLRTAEELDTVLSADMNELFQNRDADKQQFDELFAE
ncbi:ABC transporter substrate-binding protein [Ruoffia halotolerans]|nr:ABC transporter substrate-binding protein [Ruoffia halotolerans]